MTKAKLKLARKPKKAAAKTVAQKIAAKLPKIEINWPYAQEKIKEAVQEALAPYAVGITVALQNASSPRCPRCRKPQTDMSKIEWIMDAAPKITCDCGYAGSTHPDEDAMRDLMERLSSVFHTRSK